jgi:hypothetical protein
LASGTAKAVTVMRALPGIVAEYLPPQLGNATTVAHIGPISDLSGLFCCDAKTQLSPNDVLKV